MSEFKIIQATEKHREYVVSRIMYRWQESEENANYEFTRWLRNDLNSICYIGEIDGVPMATGVFDTVRDEEVLNISPYNTLLWVEPKFRGNGYGKMLTDIRFKYALDKGYKIIYLDTLDAEKYHAKHGWKTIKELDYNNEHYFIMQKVLDNNISNVAEYCKANGVNNIDGNDFEDGDDFVISKDLK